MTPLLERLGSLEFWLNATLLLAVLRVIWIVVGEAFELLLFRRALGTAYLKVRISADADRPATLPRCGCLLVRFGDDAYLRDIASERDRRQGQLRNQFVAVARTPDGANAVTLGLSLPVHKRLGTQFKLFADVDGDDDAFVDFLKASPDVSGVDPQPRFGKRRVFFLLRAFPDTETVDRNKNNIVLPV